MPRSWCVAAVLLLRRSYALHLRSSFRRQAGFSEQPGSCCQADPCTVYLMPCAQACVPAVPACTPSVVEGMATTPNLLPPPSEPLAPAPAVPMPVYCGDGCPPAPAPAPEDLPGVINNVHMSVGGNVNIAADQPDVTIGEPVVPVLPGQDQPDVPGGEPVVPTLPGQDQPAVPVVGGSICTTAPDMTPGSQWCKECGEEVAECQAATPAPTMALDAAEAALGAANCSTAACPMDICPDGKSRRQVGDDCCSCEAEDQPAVPLMGGSICTTTPDMTPGSQWCKECGEGVAACQANCSTAACPMDICPDGRSRRQVGDDCCSCEAEASTPAPTMALDAAEAALGAAADALADAARRVAEAPLPTAEEETETTTTPFVGPCAAAGWTPPGEAAAVSNAPGGPTVFPSTSGLSGAEAVECAPCAGGCIVEGQCYKLTPEGKAVTKASCDQYSGLFCPANEVAMPIDVPPGAPTPLSTTVTTVAPGKSCQECAEEFASKGGCAAFGTEVSIITYIPMGCSACGEAAKQYCADLQEWSGKTPPPEVTTTQMVQITSTAAPPSNSSNSTGNSTDMGSLLLNHEEQSAIAWEDSAEVTCQECTAQFLGNGGCKAYLRGEDFGGSIPKGCGTCGVEALAGCRTAAASLTIEESSIH